jgi:hypothetical protein
MPCPCRVHAVPLPCCAAKGLKCVFPIWFTQCGHDWFTLAMPRPCHVLTLPFFSRPRHSTSVERPPVGYLPSGFFRLPRGVPRRLSEAYQFRCRWPVWNHTTFVMDEEKSGSSTLQKKIDQLNCWTSSSNISGYHADFSRRTRHYRSMAGARYGMCELTARHGRGTAWARHAICASVLSLTKTGRNSFMHLSDIRISLRRISWNSWPHKFCRNSECHPKPYEKFSNEATVLKLK